jgi:hypothetical protein
MSLRTILEEYPEETLLVIFTTLGHVYVGRVTDIEEDTLRLARPDGLSTTVINLSDVSGVRLFEEESEVQ